MRFEQLQALKADIAGHEAEIAHMKQQKEEVEAGLDAITETLDEAEEVVEKQKAQLKAEIESHVMEHKLSMETADLAAAVVEEGLSKVGLTKEEVEALSQRVAEAGSLSVVVQQLEEGREKLAADVPVLSKKKAELEKDVTEFEAAVRVMAGLFAEVHDKEEELSALSHSAEAMRGALHEARLVAAFLTAPNGLSIPEFDAFLHLLINVRRKREGLPPEPGFGQSALASGGVLIDIDLDAARARLVEDLLPLVKDKFMLRAEHELAMARAEQEKAQLRLFNVVKSI